jgi:hypothetical protein
MAWIIAGIGITYMFDQVCTSVYDNTVKPLNDWMDQREQECLEKERIERERIQLERRKLLREKHSEIRKRYGLSEKPEIRNKDAADITCRIFNL